MRYLIFGYFLYKYGRSFISTLIRVTLGLIFISVYGFYKLFQITFLAFQESPFEILLIFAFIGNLLYGVKRLQLRVSERPGIRFNSRVQRRSKKIATLSRRDS